MKEREEREKEGDSRVYFFVLNLIVFTYRHRLRIYRTVVVNCRS